MLAVVGLYSVVSYSVSCRFKEFGIRMALGAGRGRIVNAAVQPAVLAIVAGLFAGLALSVGLNKVVARWSIGNLNDPVVLVAVSLDAVCRDADVRRDSSEPSCLDSAGRRASDRLNEAPPRPMSSSSRPASTSAKGLAHCTGRFPQLAHQRGVKTVAQVCVQEPAATALLGRWFGIEMLVHPLDPPPLDVALADLIGGVVPADRVGDEFGLDAIVLQRAIQLSRLWMGTRKSPVFDMMSVGVRMVAHP